MFELKSTETSNRYEFYASLADQARHLLEGEHDRIANAANLSSLIYHSLEQVNWVGFYFFNGDELVVGPFQGKPACVRIRLGKGVCGTAAELRETIVVPDVDAFPGHIACDGASKSEIVVPLIDGDRLVGVLDLDSPVPNRFEEADRHGLEQLAKIFLASI